MYITRELNFIEVLGTIWMPAIKCGQRINLTAYDINNIGEFTRENILDWLCCNAGDFQEIIDFFATSGNIDIEWESEDNALEYSDCMYGGME